jgi:hypothetical protein
LENIMIPSLLDVGYYFTWVPVWEDEPVPPAPEQPPGGECGAAEGSSEPDTEAAATTEPGGDADGVNDEVAVRSVFKGYRLGLMTDWVAEVNPGYERFVENRSDDDADRQRQDQRARSALRTNPHAAQSLEQHDPEPSAPSDSGD